MRIDAQRGSRIAGAAALVVLWAAARSASAAAWPPPRPSPPSAAVAPSASPPAPPQPEPAPTAIPVPLVIGSSEEALASLALLEERARDAADLDRVAGALSAEERSVERLRSDAAAAMASPSADLWEFDGELARAGERLAVLDAAMAAQARTYQAGSVELERLRAAWSATEAAPETARAPERVRARVAAVTARIDEVEARTSSYFLRLVEVQDRVVAARAALRTTSAEVARARREDDRLLFEAETAPLWRALRSIPASREAWRARSTARAHATSLREHVVAGDPRAWWQLAFLAVLAAALALLHRAAGTAASEEPLLRRPFLAAAVAALVMTPLFQPNAPPALFDLAVLAAGIPWVLVTRPLLPRRLVGPQVALTVLFVLDRLRGLAPPATISARLLLLATALGGLALLAAGMRRDGWSSALGSGRWGRAARAGLWAALVLLAVSAAANLWGNVSLATRLTRGTLTSAMAALLTTGWAMVAAAATRVALRIPAVKRHRLVAAHGPVVERRCVQLARWGALALWCWGTAVAFRVSGAAWAAAAAVLGNRLTVGSLDVALGDVVAFVVTLWLSLTLARLLRFVLDEGVLPSLPLARGLPGAISKTAQYVVVGIGLFAALYASGIELSKFSLFAGTLGVGIGFGLQNVVNNFVSGLILLYERPVQPGDIVEVGTVMGEVRRIGVRSSTVRTFQGADVIVPNGTLIATEVVNWTLSDRTRRADVAVSVAYGSDPEVVKRILLAAVERGDVLRNPEPIVLLTGFGDSSLDFEVRFWPQRIDTWIIVASDVRETILREFGRAGVEIPFPQRDLRLRTPTPAGADLRELARTLAANPAAPARTAATPSSAVAAPRDRSPSE